MPRRQAAPPPRCRWYRISVLHHFTLEGDYRREPIVVMISPPPSPAAARFQAQSNPLIAESKRPTPPSRPTSPRPPTSMSDANYSFKATPDVRTFAPPSPTCDVQMRTCSAVKGEQKQADAASKTAKATWCRLKASFDECDAAWAGITMPMPRRCSPAGSVPSSAPDRQHHHDNEEYGYLAVYIRLKGEVPPSSQGRPPM